MINGTSTQSGLGHAPATTTPAAGTMNMISFFVIKACAYLIPNVNLIMLGTSAALMFLSLSIFQIKPQKSPKTNALSPTLSRDALTPPPSPLPASPSTRSFTPPPNPKEIRKEIQKMARIEKERCPPSSSSLATKVCNVFKSNPYNPYGISDDYLVETRCAEPSIFDQAAPFRMI